jgi:hypothetical protein
MVIQSLANIATALGLIATLWIFWADSKAVRTQLAQTEQQLIESRKQTRLATVTLQAQTIYQALKDLREADAGFRNNVVTPGEIFAVMQSVYLQNSLGVIPEDRWDIFEKDFCNIMQISRLEDEWRRASKNLFYDDFVTYIHKLISQKDQKCPVRTDFGVPAKADPEGEGG